MSFPGDSSEKPCIRGRRAEWQSKLAMYMIYRYLKRLGFKGIYEAIAGLVNGFSFELFRKGKGAELSPENVRKRVQWYKKHEILATGALDILTEDGLMWDGAAFVSYKSPR